MLCWSWSTPSVARKLGGLASSRRSGGSSGEQHKMGALTHYQRGGLGLSMEGLEGVEEQRRRGKEGLKLLFVKVKVLSLSVWKVKVVL